MHWLLANKKILGYIAGAITFIIALYQLHSHIYDSGYQAAINDLTLEHNKALEAQRKDYEKQIEKSLAAIEANHQSELDRVRNEREIITKVEKVTEYVDKEIIVQAECDALAGDVVSLLSQATDIVSTTAKTN